MVTLLPTVIDELIISDERCLICEKAVAPTKRRLIRIVSDPIAREDNLKHMFEEIFRAKFTSDGFVGKNCAKQIQSWYEKVRMVL